MKYRKLRIAWSVAWGGLAVLLCAMWMRSYFAQDVVWTWLPFPLYLQINSTQGDVKVIVNAERHQPMLRFRTTDPIPVKRDWFIQLEKNPQFKWWLDIIVPHWFLTLLCAGLASIVWLPWFRLPYRFSLRTLLIATTLVAALLGLVVWLW